MMRYPRGRLLTNDPCHYNDYGGIDHFHALPFCFWCGADSHVKYIRLAILDPSNTKEAEYFYSNIELSRIFVINTEIGIYCQSYTTL